MFFPARNYFSTKCYVLAIEDYTSSFCLQYFVQIVHIMLGKKERLELINVEVQM